MRAWIECGFKDTKRGGWNWHHTKMENPARSERHWLVMAVASLWGVSVGGEVDATRPATTLETLPDTHIARRLGHRAQQTPPDTLLFPRYSHPHRLLAPTT